MQNFATREINYLKVNKNKIIIFSLVYVAGLILGLFFNGNISNTSVLYVNANNYHLIITSTSISYVSIFFKCFFAGLLLSLLTIALSFSTYLIPLISIILFYRGIILGTAFIIFSSTSGISGIVIFAILTLPVHVIITAGLITSSVLNYKTCTTKGTKNKLLCAIKNSLISIFFTLVASIYLTFIIITIIHPINLLFWIKTKKLQKIALRS